MATTKVDLPFWVTLGVRMIDIPHDTIPFEPGVDLTSKDRFNRVVACKEMPNGETRCVDVVRSVKYWRSSKNLLLRCGRLGEKKRGVKVQCMEPRNILLGEKERLVNQSDPKANLLSDCGISGREFVPQRCERGDRDIAAQLFDAGVRFAKAKLRYFLRHRGKGTVYQGCLIADHCGLDMKPSVTFVTGKPSAYIRSYSQRYVGRYSDLYTETDDLHGWTDYPCMSCDMSPDRL